MKIVVVVVVVVVVVCSCARWVEPERQCRTVGTKLSARLPIKQQCKYRKDLSSHSFIFVHVIYVNLCVFLVKQFHGLPYINPMSLSDPSVLPFGFTADTPQQQAQQTQILMNSSMMYMHQVRRFTRPPLPRTPGGNFFLSLC